MKYPVIICDDDKTLANNLSNNVKYAAENFEPIKEKKNNLWSLFPYMFKQKRLMINIILAALLMTIISICSSYSVQGIIDTLMKAGIDFDGAIGVSAGAAFGCNYKSNQIGRVLRYNVKYASDPRLSSWQLWLKTGDLYCADFCYHKLPVELDVFDTVAFQENPMDFWCVATDINNGEAVYHKLISGKEADLQWIRASSAIPVFARPVEIVSRKYWDGGISDSIPIKFFEKIGYDKNVVILTQPLSYRKEASKLYPALELILHKYPAVLKKLKIRAKDYNDVINYIRKKEVQGKMSVIRPPYPLEIGTMEKDPQELRRVYQIGVKEAKKNLQAIKTYLSE